MGYLLKICIDLQGEGCYSKQYLWKWGFLFARFSLPARRGRPLLTGRQISTGRDPAYMDKEVPLQMRVKITLRCSECKQRNYNTVKNKKNDPDRAGDEEVLPVLPEAYCSL